MITPTDRTILRDLAKRVADVAALPVMRQRRDLWKQHNSLKTTRPMMLIFPEGSWRELMPEGTLKCQAKELHPIEWALRVRLYTFEHFQDDTVVEREWGVQKVVKDSGWGLWQKRIESPENRGAWHFDPVLRDSSDLKKMRFPELTYDEAETQSRLKQAQDLFGDILDVRLRGVCHISYHLMNQLTGLHGLEETMLDMCENPGFLHEALSFYEEGHKRCLAQMIDMNLLDVNNDGNYQNSGGNGYTDDLPRPGFDPNRVRPADMWASAEAQELTLVSPAMHEEFSLQYEKRLLAPFGLTGYGCCEDLTRKLDQVLTVPNIRRISIAPVANVEACAQKLGGRAIFSWKPQPVHLVGDFDETFIRAYIRHAIDAAADNGCVMEMILKDTHTCQHHPERFDRWTQIAREEIQRRA